MKIAFTHDLARDPATDPQSAEQPATIAAIADALRRLGHDVHLVDAHGSMARLVARLEFLRPDLVFNTAAGHRGDHRVAFHPALFAELGLAYTGADAHVCARTRDKAAAKDIAAAAGLPTPAFVRLGPKTPELPLPVILKPAFHPPRPTPEPIITDAADLDPALAAARDRHPGGVIVERYVPGRDITTWYIGGAGPHDGAVPPLEDLDESTRARALEQTRVMVDALGLCDHARLSWRLGDDGTLWFISADARPSLRPGGPFVEAAAAIGLESLEAVIAAIVARASGRQTIGTAPPRPALRVGLTHNVKRIDPRGGDDTDAEYDAPTTIKAIADAIAALGHDVVPLEATPELPQIVREAAVDVCFNIAEGLHGRNREAQVPALLELLGIEYTGSDPATLGITLDKALAKRLVREAGIPTADFALLEPGDHKPAHMSYPLIVKPNAEGSSKGVTPTSVVRSDTDLARALDAVAGRYQRALVEAFLPGREFTVGLLGESKPRALPIMEIVFSAKAGPEPVYAYHHKVDAGDEVHYQVPAELDEPLRAAIVDCATRCFATLGCRDVARIDIRLDGEGRPNFIECNPLPGLTPGWSDLCIIAKAAGLDYQSLIGEILAPALRRALAARAGRR